MNDRVMTAVMLAQLVNLGVAVVASSNAVVGSGGFDLLVFELSILETLLFEAGLQKAAAAATAEVVGAVGLHVDEVFFTDDRFNDETKIFRNGIAKTLAYDLAGILYSEFDLQVLVPVGIDLQLAFTNPLGVIFVDIFNFKVMLEVEFFQSGPD
jgi:hypothetical protein